jgi:hypothetical protein
MILLDIHNINKILFALHSKHFRVYPSVNIKPVSNDLVHTIPWPGNTKGGKYHCTINLLLDWFRIMTTDNFCFYLQNRLIQTSQTGGQWYSDTSPFRIPCPGTAYLLSLCVYYVLYNHSPCREPLLKGKAQYS